MAVIVPDLVAGLHPALAALTPMRLLLAALILVPLATWLYLYPYNARRIPYANLPGPRPTSGFFGSLLDLAKAPIGTRYLALTERYGPTVRFRGLLGRWRIVSTDTAAISYVLRHTGLFHRHPSFNTLIGRMVGPGVLVVEDEPHRRQRRVLNSAFNGTSVNSMLPMFWEEAYILKDSLNESLGPAGEARMDMLTAYIATALDVIGRAGFNYHFKSHSAEGLKNPLAVAFNTMINTALENKTVALVQQVMPAALYLPTKNKATVDASRTMLDNIGKSIVADRKREIERDHISLEKSDYEGRDVISLCLRANMLANERDRMTDEEVLGQIGTLMVAGNETSATALSWATYHFITRPDIQARLREEVLSVAEDEPSAEELNSLPYLDKFVRELLRFDPPLPQVVRTAAVDCVIPLSKPVTGRDGKTITELHVNKGTDIVIPINNLNRMKEIWGPDANEFNPDRFDDPAYPKTAVPGVWGNLLSFIGGPHHCLGFRFALLEIKAVLFVVMRNFAFEALPVVKIERVAPGIVQRPIVVGEESKGIQLPVMVRRLDREE